MTDKAKKTALILIEYQNDFANPNGALYEAVKPVMDANHMLDNTKDLLAKARALGVKVLFCPITFTSDYHELSPNPFGILKGIIEKQAFQKETWGAEIIDILPIRETDIVIEGKRGLSAFYSTNLDFILRQLGIETVAVAGFLTNCCVESTLRTAYEKGFD
ncbi:MAG: isochorismatase family cysteine hydrolase, partial [Zymomonas mobilis subsp. pomaceae]